MNPLDLIALADAYHSVASRACLPALHYAPGEARAGEAARELAAIDWFSGAVKVHTPPSFDEFLNGVVADVIEPPINRAAGMRGDYLDGMSLGEVAIKWHTTRQAVIRAMEAE